MGVVKKLLAEAQIEERRGSTIRFELNENGIIHIQTDIWRIEMDKGEFRQFATHCADAGRKLRKNKGV